jgi:NAD-dependent dihydropyrimidine dehydrogenase PreA subunit
MLKSVGRRQTSNKETAMAHGNARNIYRRLGRKIDALPTRAPWNEALYEILKELYTPEEAEILVRMPYGLSGFEQVARCTRHPPGGLRATLEKLCEKGLVFDVWIEDQYQYMPAPLVVGIFEMTMMRTRGKLKCAEWAKLFHDYMHEYPAFYAANFARGKKVSIMRALPHEEAVAQAAYVEILDYEKATAIVGTSHKCAIGLCSCRNEKLHLGKKPCEVPLETCSSFGHTAEVMIRHGMAREVTASEMLENVARSRELKLVLSTDNVQKKVGFMCHCCGCCCNLLLGVSRHGCPNTIVTSTCVPRIDEQKCAGCEKCAGACPIHAMEMVASADPLTRKPQRPRPDESLCLGCGVCALTCPKNAIHLVKRKQRVLHPETTFERVILASLERGTLQNQLFDDPNRITHRFLRGLVGGFLRLPPVKQALMSDLLRSRFLNVMKSGVQKQGKAWLLEM